MTDSEDLFEVSDTTSISELLQSGSERNEMQEIDTSSQNKLLSRVTFN
jgi:hypothetical protein